MLHSTSFSSLRLTKLFIQSFIVLIVLNFLALFGSDIATLLFHQPTEKNEAFIFFGFIFWLIFAFKNKRYQKHPSH